MGYKEEQEIYKTPTEVPCPSTGKSQRCTYNDVINKSSLKTYKGEYKFKSSDQYKAKDAVRKLIQRQEKFEKEVENLQKYLERDLMSLQKNLQTAFVNIISNAEKVIK